MRYAYIFAAMATLSLYAPCIAKESEEKVAKRRMEKEVRERRRHEEKSDFEWLEKNPPSKELQEKDAKESWERQKNKLPSEKAKKLNRN